MTTMRETAETRQRRKARGRDLLLAFLCGGFAALMAGAADAVVPPYSWFCRTTGFASTPQPAKAAPAAMTLSYTFYPAPAPRQAAESSVAGKSGGI